MLDSWIALISDSVLRPSRPEVERCLQAREAHVTARRVVAEARARALASCERRIESVRAEVFAAKDGVVTSLMTQLEREWRTLARRDPDDGLMDLWARIGRPSWID